MYVSQILETEALECIALGGAQNLNKLTKAIWIISQVSRLKSLIMDLITHTTVI